MSYDEEEDLETSFKADTDIDADDEPIEPIDTPNEIPDFEEDDDPESRFH